MKFKKEDVGLYFALGLVGAGVGLLIGAYIASRRGRATTVVNNLYIPEGMTYDEKKDIFVLEEEEPIAQKFPRKKNRVEKAQEDHERARQEAKKVDSPQLKGFIVEYRPSSIQIEMVRSGVITLDELRETMLQEELAEAKEPYNYNGPYHEDDKPELSELAKLPEDEEIIDDRYEILQKPPKRKSKKNVRTIFFDQEDGTFYTLTRQGAPVPIAQIDEFISEETWEILLPYMLSGFDPLFVNDLSNAKYYKFELIPEDTEASSEDDES